MEYTLYRPTYVGLFLYLYISTLVTFWGTVMWQVRLFKALFLPVLKAALPKGWEDPVRFFMHFIDGHGEPMNWATEEIIKASLNAFALRGGKLSGTVVVSYGDYPYEAKFIPLSGWGHLDKFSPSMACVGGYSLHYTLIKGDGGVGSVWSCQNWDRYDWDDVISQKVPQQVVGLVSKLPQRVLDSLGVYEEYGVWKFRRDWNKYGTPFITTYNFTIELREEGYVAVTDMGEFHVTQNIGVYTGYYPILARRAQDAYQNYLNG